MLKRRFQKRESVEIPAGRLSMEKLSMVFEDKLVELACKDGLVATHNSKEKLMRERRL